LANGLPSLDLIATTIREERRAIGTHTDALDAKAGVILGFAGAVAALTATRRAALFQAATGVSVVAALLAMGAFFPRPSPVLNLENLRDKYLGVEERITKLVLVDTEIELRERTRSLIKRKSLLLGASMTVLSLAAVLLFVAAIVS